MDIEASDFPKYFSECSKSKGVTITATEYVFYKSLVGDTSDNIDGIKGLGYKTLHKLLAEQLENSSAEDRTLYLTNSLEYAKKLATNNSTKLEKLIHNNLDIVIRNFKLIDLSSKFASTHTIQITLKRLLEASELPARKELIHNFQVLFPGKGHMEFLLNTLFALKNIYQVPEE